MLIINTNGHQRNRLPCKYLDSINITDGIRHIEDDSIEFDGMMFTKSQYAVIDYVLEHGRTHKLVKPYVRGCGCEIKPCIRLCCPYDSFYQNRSCHRHNNNNNNKRVQRLEIAVLNEQKQTKSIILDHHFAYVTDRSCHQRYIADEYRMIYVSIM